MAYTVEITDDKIAKQVCARCGAQRWRIPGGWGRAMKDGKSVKYCNTDQDSTLTTEQYLDSWAGEGRNESDEFISGGVL